MRPGFAGVSFSTFLICVAIPSIAISQSINGAVIANTCAGGHGTYGVSVDTKIPPLAGQTTDELVSTMLAYRDGSRKGTIMNRVAKAYSEEEIRAIAEYFASFPKENSE